MLIEQKLKIGFSEKKDGPMNLIDFPEFDVPRMKNRYRFMKEKGFDPEQQVLPTLYHTSSFLPVWKPNTTPGIVVADAIATDKKGLVLTLGFADCPSIILYDPVSEAFAMVHAGWKPLAADIIPKTIRRMNETFNSFTDQMEALIGPGICDRCYEVGPEVVARFGWETNVKVQFSLTQEITKQLMACGIKMSRIELRHNICTRHSEDPIYYSYRRDKSDPLETGMAVAFMT